METFLSVYSIILITLSFISFPFYTYGLIKWYQFRRHFLIRNRFPLEMSIIIISIIILNTITTLHSIFIDFGVDFEHIHQIWIPASSVSLSCFVTTFVYYRGHLIYLECVQNRLSLKDTVSFNLSNQSPNNYRLPICCGKTEKLILPEKHWSSRLLLSYTIIGSIFVFNSKIFHLHWAIIAVLTLSLIIGLIVIIRMLKNKIKDKLGCLIDVYISTAIIIGMSIVSNMVQSLGQRQILAFLSLSALSLFGIFYPIIMLKKYEGTVTTIHYYYII